MTNITKKRVRQAQNTTKKRTSRNNKKQIYCFIDYETKSLCDIKKHGAAVYAEHPSTEVIIFGFKFSNEKKVHFWWPGQKMPAKVKAFKGLIVCHNYKFEFHITSNLMKRHLPAHFHKLENYLCTMATAVRCGLPAKLSTLCDALAIKSAKKGDIGSKLIKKYSIPYTLTTKTKERPAEITLTDWLMWLEDYDNPEINDNDLMKRFERVPGVPKHRQVFRKITADDWLLWLEYNESDILATEEIFNKLPKLHEDEFEAPIFELDKILNFNGVEVDITSTKKLIKAYESYAEDVSKKAEKLAGLTSGGKLVISSPTAFTPWLNARLPNHLAVENAQAFTLEQLGDKIAGAKTKNGKDVLQALNFRKFLAGAAVKKLYRFRDQVTKAGFAKDMLAYYGGHTGRWAGRGVQPHNIIRASAKHFAKSVKALSSLALPFLDAGHEFKILLRQLLIPGKGNKFLIGDFASIEARVLFWVAGCRRGLATYAKGLDVYRDLASVIYSVTYDKVTSKQRDIGKRGILGLGYGMGFVKFVATCWEQGRVFIDPIQGKGVVNVYRSTYPEVCELWRKVEDSFKKALDKKGKPVVLQMSKASPKIVFLYSGNSMKVTLPSGRTMFYFRPGQASTGEIKFSHAQRKIAFTWGGSLVENLVQAIARDVMAVALLACQKHPLLDPVLTVHDEIINRVKTTKVTPALKVFEKIMKTPPKWAEGLPMAAECVTRSRYEKI